MGANQLGWYLAAGDPWDTARALRAEIKRLEDLILRVCDGRWAGPRDLETEADAIRERRKNG